MSSFCIVLGAIIGWWCGWRKTADIFAREMALIDKSETSRAWIEYDIADARFTIKAARISACIIAAAIGGVLAAVACGVLLALLWIF